MPITNYVDSRTLSVKPQPETKRCAPCSAKSVSERASIGRSIATVDATFGASGVPLHEARLILGENAAQLWGFDIDALAPIVARIGPDPDELLTPPLDERYPRGDVHKPLSSV